MIDHLNIQEKEGIDCIHKEISVLEVGEHEEVDKDTHDHPEFFPSSLFGKVDQVTQVKIGCCGEDQDQEEESRGLPIEKNTDRKKECISYGPLLVDTGVDEQHYKIEAPEEEPGKDQWLLRVIEEYVDQDLTQFDLRWFA